ncbi:hypothetical protein C8R45DRAFT_1115213 [Mycena sanguinolenta]|nr:hypothetical protein C8R45DRAFT_1115213 [Mycena sanguinolenta]
MLDLGLDWWDEQCDLHHQDRCLEFEAVTFSLVADPVRQPGPPPCSGTLLVSTPSPSIPAAPSPFNTPSPLSPTPSLFASAVKKEQSPQISLRGPHMKIEQPLSPTPKKTAVDRAPASLPVSLPGRARANLESIPETPPRANAPARLVVVTPTAPHSAAGSVLVTPDPRAAPAPAPAATPLAPAPVPLPVPTPLMLVTNPNTGERTYGIRGVYTEASKTKDTCNFFTELFYEYWRLYPWCLPLGEEPPLGCEAPPEDAEAAFKALDLNLSDEESEEKSNIQTKTQEKIKQWYNRQCPAQMGIEGNPFFHNLKEMRKRNDKPAPKRPTDYQYYLQHPDYKDTLEERFNSEHADAPRNK